MNYAEIAITVPAADAEALHAFLWDEGLGFQEADQTTLDPPPPGLVRFHVFVPPAQSEAVLSSLRGALLEPGAATVSVRSRDEDEWRDAWKRYFTTRRLGRLSIVPSWEADAHQKGPGEVVLQLDPGRAFGTGGHASTRLCLRMLDEVAAEAGLKGLGKVLDVGCGCGVLAIAALLLDPGARALGVDIDPEALEVSAENAERNGVLGRFAIAGTPIEEVPGSWRTILANLSGPTLLQLAGPLSGHLQRGGWLILSGLLETEVAGVVARFRELGVSLIRSRTEDEWAVLLCQPA